MNTTINHSQNQANQDPQEIAHFSELAERWWDPKGPMKTLHQANPIRLQFIAEHLELANQKIADIGCGAGILTESLAQAGANMTGVDASKALIAAAQEHADAKQLNTTYQCAEVETYAQQHLAQFDAVTCLEMIEHVPDPQAIVAACAQMTKSNGWIFLSTLNRNLKSFLGAIVAAEYLLNWIPRGTHHYEKLIKPAELLGWCRALNLEPVATAGITYDPWFKHFKRTDDISINYMIALRKK